MSHEYRLLVELLPQIACLIGRDTEDEKPFLYRAWRRTIVSPLSRIGDKGMSQVPKLLETCFIFSCCQLMRIRIVGCDKCPTLFVVLCEELIELWRSLTNMHEDMRFVDLVDGIPVFLEDKGVVWYSHGK